MTNPVRHAENTPMRAGRIVALVAGCLMLLPGLGLAFGGGALGIAYAAGRDDAGYFSVNLPQLHSPTAAITTGSPALTADLNTSSWVIDNLDTDIRITVTAGSSDQQIFAGVGPAAAVDGYLSGVGRDEITSFTNGGTPTYRSIAGTSAATPPTAQTFWAATASGPGTQQLSWTAVNGRWAVVVMNADGSPGVAASVTVGVRAGFLIPLAVILLGLGLLITAGAVVLIVVGASRRRGDRDGNWPGPHSPDTALGFSDPVGHSVATAGPDRPVALHARLDADLSRWKWLVKWFLAFPHFVVLVFLWPAAVVTTLMAGVAILFTGVYPRSLFEFNRGVLRWSWRVSYYAVNGGIGTDQYPPFTLGAAWDYPATLDIAYPTSLSRPLVLVKWLLAIPHFLIIGLLLSNWWDWSSLGNDRFGFDPIGTGGVLGLLVVITGFILLFTGKYPTALFDLIIGFNRWIYRVVAYTALMTDEYPPFRLDQGGSEPTALLTGPTNTTEWKQ